MFQFELFVSLQEEIVSLGVIRDHLFSMLKFSLETLLINSLIRTHKYYKFREAVQTLSEQPKILS